MSDTDVESDSIIPEVEAALGALVVAFSEMELRIQHLIWALLDDEEAGQILTSAMSFKRAAAAAEQLWHRRIPERITQQFQDPDFVAEVRKRDPHATDVVDYVFRSVRRAEEERNKLLHSWWPDPSEPYWLRTPPLSDLEGATIRWKADRKTGRLRLHKVPLVELETTASKFIEIASSLAMMAGMATAPARPREVTQPNASPDVREGES